MKSKKETALQCMQASISSGEKPALYISSDHTEDPKNHNSGDRAQRAIWPNQKLEIAPVWSCLEVCQRCTATKMLFGKPLPVCIAGWNSNIG